MIPAPTAALFHIDQNLPVDIELRRGIPLYFDQPKFIKGSRVISQTTEYALRAIAALAAHPKKSQTAIQIAQITKVPPRYMSKVLQSLGRAGLLNAQRGLHGGFILARSADQITMLQVVQAIEPVNRIEHCPLGLPSHVKLCPLHKRLDQAIATIEAAFADTTIGEILAENGDSVPLCATHSKPREGKAKLTISRR